MDRGAWVSILRAWRVAAVLLAAVAVSGAGGCESDPDREASRVRFGQREALMQRAGETNGAGAPGGGDLALRDSDLRAHPEAGEAATYVFTSFRDRPDGYGLFLAVSRDGFTWRNVSREPLFVPVADNSAEMRALHEGGWWWTSGARGMRDPCLAQGPDGVFHLVWTWQRGSRSSVGYARSQNLIEWSEARMLRLTPPEWTVDFCWAPALVHDPEGRWWPLREEAGGGEWLLVWSCAVKGRFEETAKMTRHNHRLYCRRTSDFVAFSPAELFFDPGYPVIDADFYEWSPDGADSERLPVLFFKDELRHPEKKQVRMAWWETWAQRAPAGGDAADRAPRPELGRGGPPSVALTMEMCEGPSAIRIGEFTVVYFDEYTRRSYGAIRSRDLKQWEDVTPLMRFPRGHRHGSVIEVEPALGARLERMADALEQGAARAPAATR